MKNHELLCRLALTQLPGIGIAGAHKLLDATEGKAAMLFDHPKDLGDIIPGISPKIASVFDAPEVCGVVKQSFRSQKKSYSLSYL